MAHTVCGIDLGAFSVKFALPRCRLSHARRCAGSLETAVPAGEAPLIDRQLEAVRDGLSQMAGEVDAVPGGARRSCSRCGCCDLPFSDPRKIDQVVGYELEGQIVQRDRGRRVRPPGRRPAPRGVDGAGRGGQAGRSGRAAGGRRRSGHPPARALRARRSSTGRCAPATADGPEPLPAPCHAILDFGHSRTNVCVVRAGETIYARTIRRGGQHLTAAIAQAFKADADARRAGQAGGGRAAQRAAGAVAAGRQAGRGAARGAGPDDA